MLEEFSNNQLKEELYLREHKAFNAWREDPNTKCLSCKSQVKSCSCDYEDECFVPEKPKIEAPCQGDHIFIEVGDCFSSNKYKQPVLYERCKYCDFTKTVWQLLKDPNKPHYYAASIKGKIIG